MSGVRYDIVVPTIGRPSLAALLASLERSRGQRPERIVIVDDHHLARATGFAIAFDPGDLRERIEVVRGSAHGAAAARNRGSRTARSPWIVFLDDDVCVAEDWSERLVADLCDAAPACAGVAGRVHVPLPTDRRPTDWERSAAALETASWITADFAYRREAFRAVGGFDERFPRAFREDADLALRVQAAGYTLAVGTRTIEHPVRDADPWVSVRLQGRNAGDALSARKPGTLWLAQVPHERREFRRHALRVAAGVVAAAGAAMWFFRRRPLLGVASRRGRTDVARSCAAPRARGSAGDECRRLLAGACVS